jgi:ribonuclease P protein component
MSPSSVALRQTFRKSERLCSRKVLNELVLKGHTIHEKPLRLVWLSTVLNSDTAAQAAFTVPKKNFKKAVDRNSIKRRIREAYRKNKSPLYSLISPMERQFALLFIYTGKEKATYFEIEVKLKSILSRFAEAVKENNN